MKLSLLSMGKYGLYVNVDILWGVKILVLGFMWVICIRLLVYDWWVCNVLVDEWFLR